MQYLNACFTSLLLLVASCASETGVETREVSEASVERAKRLEARDQSRLAERNLKCCEQIAAGNDSCRVERLPPVYPAEALREGIHGQVAVEYSIGEDGRVRDAIILQSAPPGVFDEAALDAVLGWQFCPGEPLRGRRALIPFSTGRR